MNIGNDTDKKHPLVLHQLRNALVGGSNKKDEMSE